MFACDAEVILISDDNGINLADQHADHVIRLPDSDNISVPIFAAILLLLWAFYVAPVWARSLTSRATSRSQRWLSNRALKEVGHMV